jgi:hypothetical protein
MHDVYLIKNIETNKFYINIYSENNLLNIDIAINNILADMDQVPYPRQISDLILSINGVCLIEISDKNNNIILVTSNILPENITYHDE